MTGNEKMIELAKQFRKQVNQLADETRFESFNIDGFIDQLSDDIFDMEQDEQL